MDFKTELQNLVNRYPGIVKSVKVKFVDSIEVEPNGQAIQMPSYHSGMTAREAANSIGTPIPTNPGSIFDPNSIPHEMGVSGNGMPMVKPKQIPGNIGAAMGSALSAVAAATAAAKARVEAAKNAPKEEVTV